MANTSFKIYFFVTYYQLVLYLYTQGYVENSHLYRRSPRQESLHILVYEHTHSLQNMSSSDS